MKTVLKRTLSILLCAVLVFGAAPLQGLAELDWHLPKLPSLVSLFVTKAEAADATSGSCGTGATWNYDTETQTLTISGTGGISNYSSYQGLTYAPWRSYSDSMKTLVIKNGITSIGSYAFSGCTGLTSVTIPDSVTSIGFMAFYCTGLTRVNIDNFNAWCRISFGNDGANPLSCAHHLYMNGSEVTNAVIPTDLVAIGAYQFNGWSALETVTIPDSVPRIDSDAFSGCTGLTSITIPNSVISIGYYAFEHCSGLTSITIPDSVTSIGDLAFRGCSRLTNITIPDSVTTIGNQAFSDCSKLASIRLSSNLTAISSYAFSSCLSLSSVTIPDSVTSIGSYAFNGCSALTTVVIPDSVTIIGEKAFYQCSALKSVNIPDGVTKLDDYAFAECQTLPSISLPGSISVMGNYVFQNCKNLASITFEEEFYEIPSCTCYGCTGLKNIVFADSVKTVGSSAFYGCIGLKSLALGNGVETVGSQAFYGCSGIRSLTVPSSVETIGSSAFYNCTGLTDVALHQGLKTIDNDAFHGCVGLKAITVPAGVTTIGGSAFCDCTGLRAITLPDTLTLIGQDAFYNTAYYNNNSNWTQNVLYIGNHLVGASGISGDYEIKAGVKCIANGAFNGCSYLTGTVIPSGVTAIPYSAFYGCSRLTSVTIPDSVTSIGVDAFYGCTGLKSVTIPDSVTSIGSYAFQNCTGLTSVRLPSGLKKISSNLFNYSGLKTVKIPSSVTLIEYAAFNCSLTTVYYTGSESEWNRISISDYNTSLNNATKYFESVLEDDTQQTGTVTYYADGSHTCTLNLNLEAQWFAQENTIYNHELARFCAGFAMLGYMKGHTDKLRDALSAMGFDGDRADINLNTGRDEVNYFIADQQIIVNGRKTRLVFAGLIGSNGDQWYSNFDPDATESSMYHKDAEKGDNHLGFIDARDYVYYQLSKYYEDNNIDKGSAKLLLTGHSRGAAAANLLAAELIDNGRFANANSIYTYTFATPRGTALEKAESIRYNSIFNIVNPEDFVTKVMLDSWGFKRYGTTYTLPSKTNDNQYSKYLTNMRPNFYKYTGKTYTPYTLGEATTYAAV
ncbi:MAG: leucine-rich repeat protein, partial [Clostridia bacterium]|nr:leucine-rich repeat protein [Clostridia bacterium]